MLVLNAKSLDRCTEAHNLHNHNCPFLSCWCLQTLAAAEAHAVTLEQKLLRANGRITVLERSVVLLKQEQQQQQQPLTTTTTASVVMQRPAAATGSSNSKSGKPSRHMPRFSSETSCLALEAAMQMVVLLAPVAPATTADAVDSLPAARALPLLAALLPNISVLSENTTQAALLRVVHSCLLQTWRRHQQSLAVGSSRRCPLGACGGLGLCHGCSNINFTCRDRIGETVWDTFATHGTWRLSHLETKMAAILITLQVGKKKKTVDSFRSNGT